MATMSLAGLLVRIRERGIELWVDDGRLRFRAPPGQLDDELKRLVQAHKAELIALLEPGTNAAGDVIPRADRDRPLVLSSGQRRLWFLEQLEPGSPAYNVVGAMALVGELDPSALARALARLVERHEILRTRFRVVDDEPRQEILAALPVPLPLEDFAGADDQAVQATADAWARLAFDLASGPCFRARLLRRGPAEHVFLLAMHHIVADGWSVGVIFRELAALYDAFRSERADPLPPLALQYADYAAWQQERAHGEGLAQQLAYWRAQLAGLPPLTLAGDPSDDPLASGGASCPLVLSTATSERVRALARAEETTPFVLLLAAFAALLARYSGQQDLAIGSPVANRNRRELEELIGFFVNSLVLRIDLDGDPTFRQLLQRVKRCVVDAQANQELPFDRLVEELVPARSVGRTPLFVVMFALHADTGQRLQVGGLAFKPLPLTTGAAKFDLTLQLTDGKDGFAGALEYRRARFHASSAARLVEHYGALVDTLAQAPDRRLSQAPISSAGERHQLLGDPRRSAAAATPACLARLDDLAWAADRGVTARPAGRGDARLYLLDDALELLPLGAAGELYVDGHAIGRGDDGDSARTAERWRPSPFVPGARLFRTGVTARWRADGSLDVVATGARTGDRGPSAALRRIEVELGQFPGVREAAVTLRASDRQLVAYVVPRELGCEPSAVELRTWLRTRLADGWIPSTFVVLDRLPRLPAAAVDASALPAAEARVTPYRAPRNPIEQQLAELWSELLARPRLGIDDDFFDLGGHSLLATQLIGRVRAVLRVDLPLRVLFESSTIAKLAARIGEARGWSSDRPPLAPTPRHEGMPLSSSEERMWLLAQLESEHAPYAMGFALHLRGPLSVPALDESLAAVIARHESLRTIYPLREGRPERQIQPPAATVLTRRHLRPDALAATVHAERTAPFALARGPLLRATLLQLADDHAVLVIAIHHLVCDGWSLSLLVDEIVDHYAARTGQGAYEPRPLPLQYADYAVWQRRWLSDGGLDRALTQVRERLLDAPHILELPTDRPRRRQLERAGGAMSFALPDALFAELRALARRERVTLFSVGLTALSVLLARLSGQRSLIIGTPVANRDQPELEPLIGYLLNTVPVRVDLPEMATWRELLQSVHQRTLDALAHQHLPFERIVESLQVERDPTRTPLVQVLFNMVTAIETPRAIGELVIERMAQEGDGFLETDLQWVLEGQRFTVRYRRDLFAADRIASLGERWLRLLAELAAQPETRWSTAPLLSDDERQELLTTWNDTERPLTPETVDALIERQVARSPDAVAVTFADRSLTFAELDARANRLAHRLRAHGVGVDGRVAIVLDRSLEMMVAILGTLKAGAAYVPIDPSYPQGRIALMLRGARPALVLTQARHRDALPGDATPRVELDADSCDERAPEPAHPLRLARDPQTLAYLIHTSGSTGTPKGVMSTHAGLCNRLHWMQSTFGLTAADVVLQKTPLSFDVSVWELFWPLISGARLVIAAPDGHKDPKYLRDLIVREGVTTLHFVPSMLNLFLDVTTRESCPRLRLVLASGEALTPPLAAKFHQRLSGELHNLYGPTEASIDVSWWPVGPATPALVPIGRPIANTQLYILDEQLEPVPVGVSGELFIGGVQLARGYHDRPDLTAERFVPHPFVAGARLYRTGDRCRHLRDGNIEFLGRLDAQVKVRGFRIELGEIEAVAEQHPDVRHAAAITVRDATGATAIAAYVAGSPSSRELRAFLKERLPEHMVPAQLVVLDELPLSANGKIDRRRLPRLTAGEVERDFVPPATPTEAHIAALFAELLQRPRVGADDNFFELGGHSLLAVAAVARLGSELGIELPLRALFDATTVRELARALDTAASSSRALAVPLVACAPADSYELSHAQQRMWLAHHAGGDASALNVCVAFRFTSPAGLAPERVRRALQAIVRRHESLRTRFERSAGAPRQIIEPDVPLPLVVTDLRAEPTAESLLRDLRYVEDRRAFELTRAPLFRVHLVQLRPGEDVILFTLHHIITDAWSVGVLVDELLAHYEAGDGHQAERPPLPVQYKDYVAYHRELLRAQPGLREFWRQQLLPPPAPLALPTDRPRPAQPSRLGARHRGAIDRVAVRRFSRVHGVTEYMTLLTLYQILLSRLTAQDDIVVGSPAAGRTHPLLAPQLGCYVNTLPIRTRIGKQATVRDVLASVRATALAAFEHQLYPFDLMVHELGPARDSQRNPLFEVALVLQNVHSREQLAQRLDALPHAVQARALEPTTVPVHFDLTFVFDEGDLDSFAVDYRSDLFDPATIETIAADFTALAVEALAHPDRRVADLQASAPIVRPSDAFGAVEFSF
jgi:amino acid adenylation domain-containing protein